MVIVYFSNKLELFKEIFFELLSDQLTYNPLQSEIILVENETMSDWINIELAMYFGISANISFFFPLNFIWNIFYKSLWNIFPENYISRPVIIWMLMKIITNINSNYNYDSNFDYIKRYLCDDSDKRKCFQLSEKIADLFIQYFIYRSDWLMQWKSGNKITQLDSNIQDWQYVLWRLFLEEMNLHNNLFSDIVGNVYRKICNILNNNHNKLFALPKRIFVFGVISLTPVFLEILNALGKYIEIYIFCINPCRFLLYKNMHSDVLSKKLYIMLNKEYLLFDDYQKSNFFINTLLFSWGELFRENFYSCLKLNILQEVDIFENPETISLLHVLQNDILNNYVKIHNNTFTSNIDKASNKENIRFFDFNDNSLSVHVCHSLQREIEVLHDNLLAIMSDDPLILPHEIIVMAPNISQYVSIIYSVFNHASYHNRCLPFSIFEYKVENRDPILLIVFKLLQISHIRFTVKEIFEFLEIPAISMCFKIDESSVILLRQWILESGICWGLDDDVLNDLVIPSYEAQYTWKFGLTRMLLGYAMDIKYGSWKKILPYNIPLYQYNEESFFLIGQLGKFLMQLNFWRTRFRHSHMLKEWLPYMQEMINSFFIEDFSVEVQSILTLIKNCWSDIISCGIKADYLESISIDILYEALYNKLHFKRIKKNFFSGGISFCNLSEVHSIPFKIVYLLGMNLSVYPRHNMCSHINLMSYDVRFGDYNQWYHDRYLFLEALLSARKKLFISFIDYFMCDYERYYPSTLVDELFEYIVNNFYYVEKNTKDILSLTIEWIYTRFFIRHTHVVYALENFSNSNKNQSFFKEWLLTEDYIFDTLSLGFSCKLNAISVDYILLKHLYDFYSHPIRAWFNNRLKISIPKISNFPNNEVFVVDSLIQYQICLQLITIFLDHQDVDIFYKNIRLSGYLPYGSFGEIFWIKQYGIIQALSDTIYKFYNPRTQYNLEVSLLLGNIRLHGTLFAIQEHGILRWKPTRLSIRDGLLLWIEHLMYCAMGGTGNSRMFGINTQWCFESLSVSEAKEYLLYLIHGYYDGMEKPLFLFSYFGEIWLKYCFDIKTKTISLNLMTQHIACKKIISAWDNHRYIYRENIDPYVKKIIPNRLQENDIALIVSATRDYFVFPMIYNIICDTGT